MPLFLIRHAQSANNAKPEHQRIPDPPITELGESQAERLGQWVEQMQLTRLIASPFLRTLQTAMRIQQATGLPLEVRSEWHEHGGCYSGWRDGELRGEPGMTREEIEQIFPKSQIADNIDHEGWWKRQDWETVAEARKRAERVAAESHEEFDDATERIAIVTHADFKRFFVESIHSNYVDVPMNTSISTVERTPTGFQLVEYNQVEHLPAELQSW